MALIPLDVGEHGDELCYKVSDYAENNGDDMETMIHMVFQFVYRGLDVDFLFG